MGKLLFGTNRSSSVLHSLCEELCRVMVTDADGSVLVGRDTDMAASSKFPVKFSGETLGCVSGEEKTASIVASQLSRLAEREIAIKTLAQETLDVYREVNLLYEASGWMTTCPDLVELGQLIINEAKKRLNITSGSLMLLNNDENRLDVISAFGMEHRNKALLKPGVGVAGDVLITGRAEVVNDVMADPRFVPCTKKICSMMCAPLREKDRIFGVFNVSNQKPVVYTSRDIKLLNALSSQAAAIIENTILNEKKLKDEMIRNNLERYLDPQVALSIMQSRGKVCLSSERRNIAILFSDIRNFTSKCEELEPEIMVGYLNEYFSMMVKVVFDHQGTVNKFVGDMIVALFGAPSMLDNNEKRAVQTAIEMQKRLESFPNEWIRSNFKTGIGINSGDVIIGNIGSPQHMDYTAIGDGVNIASRLQSLARGRQILVSKGIHECTKSYFEFEPWGKTTIKGKKRKVEIFELIY